jgi:hypothetical protein
MPPEEPSSLALTMREELVDALTDTVTDVIARLSPVARLRLLAFMHLIDQPETVQAELEVEPSGLMRLRLVHSDAVGTPH